MSTFQHTSSEHAKPPLSPVRSRRAQPSVAGAVALGLLSAAAAVVTVYGIAVRRWHLRWGATRQEVQRPLPGDEQVPHPRIQSTRAVTIHAPRAQVWPWLVQLGQGRGGFYSYTALQNLLGAQIHNAARIVPEWQGLQVGDFIRIAPERFGPEAGFRVARLEAPRLLVLCGGPPQLPGFSWAFVLEDRGAATRLIVRARFDFPPTPGQFLLWRGLTEPAHFVMERRMLLSLKALAEKEEGRSSQAARPLLPFSSQPGPEHQGRPAPAVTGR